MISGRDLVPNRLLVEYAISFMQHKMQEKPSPNAKHSYAWLVIAEIQRPGGSECSPRRVSDGLFDIFYC
jgi:hypothetical protein